MAKGMLLPLDSVACAAAVTRLRDCPPVTLAIESGAGEFPTGPSITFAAGSEIPIRDGTAAFLHPIQCEGVQRIGLRSQPMSQASCSPRTRYLLGPAPPGWGRRRKGRERRVDRLDFR